MNNLFINKISRYLIKKKERRSYFIMLLIPPKMPLNLDKYSETK